ncbi:MAG: hypothetical protein ABWU14_01460 [Limnospira maxima]
MYVLAAVVADGVVQVLAVCGVEGVGGNLDMVVFAGDEEGLKPGFGFRGEIPLDEGGLRGEEAAQVGELRDEHWRSKHYPARESEPTIAPWRGNHTPPPRKGVLAALAA